MWPSDPGGNQLTQNGIEMTPSMDILTCIKPTDTHEKVYKAEDKQLLKKKNKKKKKKKKKKNNNNNNNNNNNR